MKHKIYKIRTIFIDFDFIETYQLFECLLYTGINFDLCLLSTVGVLSPGIVTCAQKGYSKTISLFQYSPLLMLSLCLCFPLSPY